LPATWATSRNYSQWSSGDRVALDSLTQVVYTELRKLAGGYLRRKRRDHTLQPALAPEAWMRLVKQDQAMKVCCIVS